MIDIDELDDNFLTAHRRALVMMFVAAAGVGLVAMCRFHTPQLAIEQHQRNPDVAHQPVIVYTAPTPQPVSTPPPAVATPLPEKFAYTEVTPATAPTTSSKPLETPGLLPTSITPGANGLRGLSPNGNGIGGDGIGGDSGAGYAGDPVFAGKVESAVADAIRANPRTRNAALNLKVRIWPDATGRIVNAQLEASTGDPALDALLRNKILLGLSIGAAPPAGLHLPIVMSVTAQRP
jgi:periplasmic protein TonB